MNDHIYETTLHPTAKKPNQIASTKTKVTIGPKRIIECLNRYKLPGGINVVSKYDKELP
jgi:hypothetical protein